MEYSGEYGGVVKREFSGDGKKWIVDAILSPEDVIHWPLGNRMALHKEGKIDWFGPPVEAENKARNAGKPAKAKGVPAASKEKAPAKDKATPDAAPVSGRRRVRS